MREGIESMSKMPTYDSLMNPLIRALRLLGGSGSIAEMYEKVIELEDIPEEVHAQMHTPGKGNETEVAYRLAWARTYLKKYGLLENSIRGVWVLTPMARDIQEIDPSEVVRKVRALDKTTKTSKLALGNDGTGGVESEVAEEEAWKAKLLHILMNEMEPDAFERLAQRILRESGFVSVEVTGRSGDGGIDGRGIARIHGLLSLHVIFQCKRYQRSVSPAEIRDFRGAMVGRTDKGLFITTGSFTSEAVKEATRDGAPAIDLVDGNELVEKLRELQLGVTTKTIERVVVNEDWFKTL